MQADVKTVALTAAGHLVAPAAGSATQAMVQTLISLWRPLKRSQRCVHTDIINIITTALNTVQTINGCMTCIYRIRNVYKLVDLHLVCTYIHTIMHSMEEQVMLHIESHAIYMPDARKLLLCQHCMYKSTDEKAEAQDECESNPGLLEHLDTSYMTRRLP